MSGYFTKENCKNLSTVSLGDHIHVIGVCGVAMAQIALELASQGYKVSGSDKEFYDPMGSLLKKSSVELFEGYDPNNIKDSVKLVIIGNAISSNNPELSTVENRKIPFTIFPQILSDLVISSNKSIVVTGTHGKSTTSAIGATVFAHNQLNPSFFIGGVVKNFESSLSVGSGKISVVEGDEYDSAFFAKIPKFFFYRADCLIITSIEFDHADIYSSLEQIEEVFFEAAKRVSKDGFIIACADCPNVMRLISKWNDSLRAKIITYGTNSLASVRIVSRTFKDGLQSIELLDANSSILLSNIPVLGLHNARNITSIYIACKQLGLSVEQINKGLCSFKGVKRRQDVRLSNERITIVEDFAHHPTAVKETLSAIKEGYPRRRIICLFEPRSNTSRRKVFESDYGSSFSSANLVVIKQVQARQNDLGVELMDIGVVSQLVNASGVKSLIFDNVNEIISYVEKEAKPGDVVVVMSNGSFDGIIDKLCARF
jgi:UDP-N-acetylmuramate: L-alanyl-gamma-D-glutamyl-meso-diaminopimelate ligase